jgi:hypothetical protein
MSILLPIGIGLYVSNVYRTLGETFIILGSLSTGMSLCMCCMCVYKYAKEVADEPEPMKPTKPIQSESAAKNTDIAIDIKPSQQ